MADPEVTIVVPASLPPIAGFFCPLPPFNFRLKKSLLVQHCDYFRTVFEQAPCLPFYAVPEPVSPSSFKILIDYMQTGNLQLNSFNLWDVLPAAQALGMREFTAASQGSFLRHAYKPAVISVSSQHTVDAKPETSANHLTGATKPILSTNKPNSSRNAPKHNSIERVQRKLLFKDYCKMNSNQPDDLVDVAACDGPVVFTKVRNANYQPLLLTSPDPSIIPVSNAQQQTQSANKVFSCTSCRETFKSRNCFEKHKQRHLLPVDANTDAATEPDQTLQGGEGGRKPISTSASATNVRFFPCRNCGRKFPSYYFVHKHQQQCDQQTVSLKKTTTSTSTNNA